MMGYVLSEENVQYIYPDGLFDFRQKEQVPTESLYLPGQRLAGRG